MGRLRCYRLLLLHVEELRTFTFEEFGVSWFWAVPGTGVFVSIDALREHGTVLELTSRDDWSMGWAARKMLSGRYFNMLNASFHVQASQRVLAR